MGVRAFDKGDLLDRMRKWAQEYGQHSNVTTSTELMIEALEQWEEHDRGIEELAGKVSKLQDALDAATRTVTDKEQEVTKLREALEWYANEQNYTWSGAPGRWEEKTYHKTQVKIPVPDMGQKAREALNPKTKDN